MGLILSATLVPLFLIVALVLLYLTVFKPMFTSWGLGVPDGPASTVAMQPVLTIGPDGDLKDTELLDTVLADTETEKDVPYPGAEQLTKAEGTKLTEPLMKNQPDRCVTGPASGHSETAIADAGHTAAACRTSARRSAGGLASSRSTRPSSSRWSNTSSAASTHCPAPTHFPWSTTMFTPTSR